MQGLQQRVLPVLTFSFASEFTLFEGQQQRKEPGQREIKVCQVELYSCSQEGAVHSLS